MQSSFPYAFQILYLQKKKKNVFPKSCLLGNPVSDISSHYQVNAFIPTFSVISQVSLEPYLNLNVEIQ